MGKPWVTFVSCLAIVTVVSATEGIVNTTSGFVMGTLVQGFNVTKFLGIPYAEPPIGELRFKPPIMKNRVSGTFQAAQNGFACPQIIPPLSKDFSFLSANLSTSENCLTLNIYKPISASKATPLSVMVWVYGGGYVTGAASMYDASLLAGHNDVIVVVINYRLGILGFLDTMDNNAVGNFGLRDQCLALQWIKNNIEEFGGNASSITIFGESAGASSVTQLTMAADCQGLFHRVIAESGNPLASWSHNPDPLKTAKDLGNKIGCSTNTTNALVQCLREKPVNELLKYQSLAFDITGDVPWAPSYTSDFFPSMLKERKEVHVVNKMSDFDLLIGLNWEEGEFFYDYTVQPQRAEGKINDRIDGLPDSYVNQTLIKVARSLLPEDTSLADKLIPSLRFQYTEWKDSQNKFSNSLEMVKLIGDIMMHVSSVQYARMLEMKRSQDHSGRGKTYFYRLKHRGSWMTSDPWSTGATHGQDIYLLFGATLVGLVNATAGEKQLSHVMMEYWTNFAKTGDPNEPSKRHSNTQWPPYSATEEEYIELDVNMTQESTRKHPYPRRVAFWDKFIPEQVRLIRNEEAIWKSCQSTTSPTTTHKHGEVIPEIPVVIG